ncbi:MAG: phospholipid scramblase-related protein [Desertimonas sp.]
MSQHPADWYPDPTKRHEHRYYDGTAWTDHVSNQGVTGTDPVNGPAPRQGTMDRLDAGLAVGDEGAPDRLARQLRGTGYRGANIQTTVEGGGGTIFSEPILIVNQKAKIIELSQQFQVFDQHGRPIAVVAQVGQSAARKALRLLTNFDQYMTTHLDVTTPDGQPLLRLTRPRKMFKSTVVVSDGHGAELGRIVQQNMVGKINFGIEANGQHLGSIKGENWRAWNWRIEDHTGTEIARITKTFEGALKTAFTTADNYVVQIHARQPEPLHTLIVASALSIDTALKQDARGLGA